MIDNHNFVTPARMRDGSEYVGNQQFAGRGFLRCCATCGQHRSGQGRWGLLRAGMSCPDCVVKAESEQVTKPTTATQEKRQPKPSQPWDKPGFSFQVRDESGAIWPPQFSPRLHFTTGPRAIGEAITQQLTDPANHEARSLTIRKATT